MIITKFPSFEEAYEVGNRFWPILSTEIQKGVSWDKVKELVLAQAAEGAGADLDAERGKSDDANAKAEVGATKTAEIKEKTGGRPDGSASKE